MILEVFSNLNDSMITGKIPLFTILFLTYTYLSSALSQSLMQLLQGVMATITI